MISDKGKKRLFRTPTIYRGKLPFLGGGELMEVNERSFVCVRAVG